MTTEADKYFVPGPSPWPVITTGALFFMLLGMALALNGVLIGAILIFIGIVLFAYILFGWFGELVEENLAGRHNEKVDASFRYGMFWFIASEVFFFLSFFGALYYIRNISVDWLGGTGYLAATHDLLYSQFEAQWPTAGPGTEESFTPMGAWGIPALNTLILLTSGATITWAHWGLKSENRALLVKGLAATIGLGVLFVILQAWEYQDAWERLNLTLSSGVYGSTFYMLTGFHGLHVTMGTIMLAAILVRSSRGHFTPQNHFAFEAVAWYWHFVDVVWLALFFLVYWM
ncbi:MAG: cytochrome c oxidase subunit 3 [Proteobacteria bacterium]|nr:cytochrome c oxidase subunit 3 [Pseudomonadota bacterium]